MRFFSVGLFQIIKRMHKRYDKQILKNIINLKMGGQVVQRQFLASGQHFPEYQKLHASYAIWNMDSMAHKKSCRSKSALSLISNFSVFCLLIAFWLNLESLEHYIGIHYIVLTLLFNFGIHLCYHKISKWSFMKFEIFLVAVKCC